MRRPSGAIERPPPVGRSAGWVALTAAAVAHAPSLGGGFTGDGVPAIPATRRVTGPLDPRRLAALLARQRVHALGGRATAGGGGAGS